MEIKSTHHLISDIKKVSDMGQQKLIHHDKRKYKEKRNWKKKRKKKQSHDPNHWSKRPRTEDPIHLFRGLHFNSHKTLRRGSNYSYKYARDSNLIRIHKIWVDYKDEDNGSIRFERVFGLAIESGRILLELKET